MRLLDQTDGSAAVLSEEQQRDLIFQNLLRKYLAKQAEEAGLPDQPEVAEKIRVLAEEAQLYSAALRNLVPEATLTTSPGGWTVSRRCRAVPTTRFCIRKSNARSAPLAATLIRRSLRWRGGSTGADFSNVGGDLGLSAEAQRMRARPVAVANCYRR